MPLDPNYPVPGDQFTDADKDWEVFRMQDGSLAKAQRPVPSPAPHRPIPSPVGNPWKDLPEQIFWMPDLGL